MTELFIAWVCFMASLILIDVVMIWRDIHRMKGEKR